MSKLKLNLKSVISISSEDVISKKDLKIKLAPMFNSIADKHDLGMYIDKDGEDYELEEEYDEFDEHEY